MHQRSLREESDRQLVSEMQKIAIVAAGQFPRKEYPLYLLGSASKVICCDSALGALEKRGIVPDVVIGDMDSVCGRALARFKGTVVRSDDQECNDLTKAFRYVMENWRDVTEITIIGGTGRSEAHTLGNMSLLMQYEADYDLSEKGITLQMVSDYSTMFAICGSCELHVGKGRRISIFSPDPSLNIRSEGLEWPTDKVVFDNWWKASLNIASEDVVKLTLDHTSKVLIVLD